MLNAIYYPFSRCINNNSLKQMLLLFESISFLDPVSDNNWRAQLMKDLENQDDIRFKSYQEIHEPTKDLIKDQVIKIIKPSGLDVHTNKLTAFSAISDLLDENWTRVASRPMDFNMPHRRSASDNSATWQIFKDKLPGGFLDALEGNESLEKHLVHKGDDNYSWTLSYEAGSAISTSMHLAAADELTLAPITDSRMHHHLLLRKSMRNQYGLKEGNFPLTDSAIGSLVNQSAMSLINEFLPAEVLARVSLEEIIRFREETKLYRQEFVADLNKRLSIVKSEMGPEHLIQIQKELTFNIEKEVKEFKNEIANARDKIWPQFVSSLNKNLAAGGVAAITLNSFGGPALALAGSILPASITLLKGMLDIKAEKSKAIRSTSPSVTFMSKIETLVK
ncbi:MAG: hypothetical protein ACI8WB_001200 [Phenylobacterium sp.]|jgi:hypothetical protein